MLVHSTMHEDESSMVSHTKLNNNVATTETSDSGYRNLAYRGRKRCRPENPSSVRFKGVVPQQNGNWGAQIYANHQRIWLGTFKFENEAAMAYDSAGIKLRNGEAHRNFPWTHFTIHEPNFQTLYTTEDVLNMIRDGSYQTKFSDFVKLLSEKDSGTTKNTISRNLVYGGVEFSCAQLFEKELTPSDVGKLNRLVIPKKYAAKYFPYINNEEHLVSGEVQDIELVFCDKLMKTWNFRYCYWRSSQSFVFTRGWSRFVKEKNLREGDVITFYSCESSSTSTATAPIVHGAAKCSKNFFLIDVNYIGELSCMKEERLESSAQPYVNFPVELELNLGTNLCCLGQNVDSGINEEKGLSGFNSSHNVEEKTVFLFGVQIN